LQKRSRLKVSEFRVHKTDGFVWKEFDKKTKKDGAAKIVDASPANAAVKGGRY